MCQNLHTSDKRHMLLHRVCVPDTAVKGSVCVDAKFAGICIVFHVVFFSSLRGFFITEIKLAVVVAAIHHCWPSYESHCAQLGMNEKYIYHEWIMNHGSYH